MGADPNSFFGSTRSQVRILSPRSQSQQGFSGFRGPFFFGLFRANVHIPCTKPFSGPWSVAPKSFRTSPQATWRQRPEGGSTPVCLKARPESKTTGLRLRQFACRTFKSRPRPSNQKIRRHPRHRLRLLGVLVVPQQPARLGVLVLAQARLGTIKGNHAPRGLFCLGALSRALAAASTSALLKELSSFWP